MRQVIDERRCINGSNMRWSPMVPQLFGASGASIDGAPGRSEGFPCEAFEWGEDHGVLLELARPDGWEAWRVEKL
jgi:hypothetical protein